MWVSGPLVTRRTRLSPCLGLPVGELRCLNLGALCFFFFFFWKGSTSSNAILNDISNPAAQPENCLLPSAETNAFTQKHPPVLGRNGLSVSGAGKCLEPNFRIGELGQE